MEMEVGHQEEITAQCELAWLFTPCKSVGNFNTLCVFTHGNKNIFISC